MHVFFSGHYDRATTRERGERADKTSPQPFGSTYPDKKRSQGSSSLFFILLMGKFERTPHSRVRQDNPSPNSGLKARRFGGFGNIASLNGSRFGQRTWPQLGVQQEVRSPNSWCFERDHLAEPLVGAGGFYCVPDPTFSWHLLMLWGFHTSRPIGLGSDIGQVYFPNHIYIREKSLDGAPWLRSTSKKHWKWMAISGWDPTVRVNRFCALVRWFSGRGQAGSD